MKFEEVSAGIGARTTGSTPAPASDPSPPARDDSVHRAVQVPEAIGVLQDLSPPVPGRGFQIPRADSEVPHYGRAAGGALKHQRIAVAVTYPTLAEVCTLVLHLVGGRR